MKKTKLFTSLVALALVLGLGACDEIIQDTTDEGGETSETTETEETGETGDTSESSEPSESTETGDTSDTGTGEGEEKNEIPYKLDESYFLGFEYEGTKYYATGETVSGYSHEGVVSTNIGLAVSMKLTKATGDNAYYLSFELGEETYYVCIITVGGYEDLQYVTEPTPIYWDDTNKAFVNEVDTYFLCYNSTYKCLWASEIASWISSSPIVGLYDIPENWEPYVPSTTLEQVSALENGNQYYIGALSDGDYHLATATMAGSYNVTTTTDIEQACAYTASGNDNNGWTLTNASGQYLYFYVSSGYLDLGLSNATNVPNSGTKVFSWSSQDKTLYTTSVVKSGYSYSYFEYYTDKQQLAAYGGNTLGSFSQVAYFYQYVTQ